MKYEKLKQLNEIKCKNARLCLVFGLPTILGLFVMLVTCITADRNDTPPITIMLICLGVIAICGSITCVFGFKEEKYINIIEDYIILKVREVVQNNDIQPHNFEVIKDAQWKEYRIGFHNQIIDYNNLQKQIDAELDIMNAIVSRGIRVRLI